MVFVLLLHFERTQELTRSFPILSHTQTALKYPTPNEIGSEFLSGLNTSLVVAEAQGCSRSHCQRESRRVETVTWEMKVGSQSNTKEEATMRR